MLRVGSATVALTSNDLELEGWLIATFRDLGVPDTADLAHDHEIGINAESTGASLTIDGHVAYASRHRANVIDHFVAWCNRLAIESQPDSVNLHAAGLVPPGRSGCIVVPGAPGAGKSSLATAALRAGWGYLSDELISIDADGVAHPYAKPLTLKRGTRALYDEQIDFATQTLTERQMRWYVRPDLVGGELAPPSTPDALAFSTYDPDVATTAETLSATETLVELGANCQDQLDADGRLFVRLARLAATTPAVRMTQRHLGEALEILCDLPSGRTGPSAAPVVLEAPAPVEPMVGPRVADAVVAVAMADGVAVHRPGDETLVALDPLAGAIWQLLDGSATHTELAAELAEAFDHPVDAVTADLTTLLDALWVQGLLADGWNPPGR